MLQSRASALCRPRQCCELTCRAYIPFSPAVLWSWSLLVLASVTCVDGSLASVKPLLFLGASIGARAMALSMAHAARRRLFRFARLVVRVVPGERTEVLSSLTGRSGGNPARARSALPGKVEGASLSEDHSARLVHVHVGTGRVGKLSMICNACTAN